MCALQSSVCSQPAKESDIVRLTKVRTSRYRGNQGGAAGTGNMPEQVELLSLGSAGHHVGACKPCVFLHTKGCTIGSQCQFCHLCGPDEKKRRQKEKRQYFHQLRASQASVSSQCCDGETLSTTSSDSAHVSPPKNTDDNAVCVGLCETATIATSPTVHTERSREGLFYCPSSSSHTAHLGARPALLGVLCDTVSVPYIVRNTFVETSLGLDGDFEHRACSSCPASKIGRMQLTVDTQYDDVDTASTGDFASSNPETPQSFPSTPWPATPESMALSKSQLHVPYLGTGYGFHTQAMPVEMQMLFAPEDTLGHAENYPLQTQPAGFSFVEVWSEATHCCNPQFPATTPSTSQLYDDTLRRESVVLSLAEIIDAPVPEEVEAATVELVPSIGSMGHSVGNCKPCGFFHKAGCSAGARCTFCHLCDRGEKKRRQQEKRDSLRATGQQKTQFSM